MSELLPRAVLRRERGLRISAEGSLLINSIGGGGDLYEVKPVYTQTTGPALVFYDISAGRGEDERKLLMTLTVSAARWLFKYLPMLINNAERLSRH